MADRDVRTLCWSVAIYYVVLASAIFIVRLYSGIDDSIGETLSNAIFLPVMAILLFLGGPTTINVWVGWAVVIAVLGALAAAIVCLRGKLRIAAVLAILTAMNVYAVYVAVRAGA